MSALSYETIHSIKYHPKRMKTYRFLRRFCRSQTAWTITLLTTCSLSLCQQKLPHRKLIVCRQPRAYYDPALWRKVQSHYSSNKGFSAIVWTLVFVHEVANSWPIYKSIWRRQLLFSELKFKLRSMWTVIASVHTLVDDVIIRSRHPAPPTK